MNGHFLCSGSRQSGLEVRGWLEMLDQHLHLASTAHARLFDVEVRCLVRGKEDVVMRRILAALELVWSDVAARWSSRPVARWQVPSTFSS
ncbi:hypothetical protein [Verrucomicrobium spinosum]|uniref:hypothetical protein n=1 Tax=Verrucomicrobium spinosum TaxID=2736 RepID=UPI000ACDB905|nr:hypothetical protein [Verrucomicrobium spinosum]